MIKSSIKWECRTLTFSLSFRLESCRFSLEIKVHAILGAKICGHVGKDLFCHLTNRYSHEYNYRTNRLACVPEIAGEVMHQNLFVSGAFAFASKLLSLILNLRG